MVGSGSASISILPYCALSDVLFDVGFVKSKVRADFDDGERKRTGVVMAVNPGNVHAQNVGDLLGR